MLIDTMSIVLAVIVRKFYILLATFTFTKVKDISKRDIIGE